jgi:DNA-binding NtrC family response regulator/pSer/pThr/pTyr-binding forkhead associated (FHA) protein
MSSGQYDEELTGEGAARQRPARMCVVALLKSGAVSQPLRESGTMVIGRGSDANLVVAHPSVSRRHAVIDVDLMTFMDLGSRNGSTVRGERLKPNSAVAISPGDAIAVGDITLVLRSEDDAAPERLSVPNLVTEQPLELRLVEEAARSARTGEPFAHARIHVDRASAEIAREVIVEALRTSDVLVEDCPGTFQLLLPNSDNERARPVIQRITAALTEQGITARAGVASYPYDGVTAAQLSARARELVTATRRERTPMDDLRRLVTSVATGELTVLVTGETGSGKELIAEMLHRLSPRKQRPFLRLNCAAIAEQLLESELFGHARGAFTGAENARAGLFESAAGGTVLLDEIGEMGLRLQASLLRVLEERVVRRVGESEVRPVDVRIVCATNRSLLDEVDAGRFRRDLYYRIGGVTVTLPPLRERPDEIEAIARAFAALATARTRRSAPVFSDHALAALRAYTWSGNIRELRNAIERAVLLAGDGSITPTELGLPSSLSTNLVTAEGSQPPLRPSQDPKALSREVAELEKRRIIEALEHFGGNQTRAARALGLSRTTLVARLEQYSLRRPRKT